MSTADGFFPTIASIDGKGMERFYNRNSSWDGWVEIRAALNEQKARDCGFWSDDAIFLPLESAQVHPAKSIVMFYRSILAKGPRSAGAASKACGNGALCGNPPFLRSIMQDQYPGRKGGREGGREEGREGNSQAKTGKWGGVINWVCFFSRLFSFSPFLPPSLPSSSHPSPTIAFPIHQNRAGGLPL